jgi:CHAT domain-containing protein/predicted negative regulator of RcsB-dependent stress response
MTTGQSFLEAAETLSASNAMEQGQDFYRRGAFPQAILSWTEAARLFEKDGKTHEQIQAQISLAQALYQIGHYGEAGAVLRHAQTLAQNSQDRSLLATVRGRLGNVYFALGQNEQAIQLLNDGLALSREIENSLLTAVLLNDLGNVLAAEGRYAAAVSAYTECSIIAKGSGNQPLGVIAMINAGRASIQEGSFQSAKARVDTAAVEIQALNDSHDKAYGLLNLGVAYEDLRPNPSQERLLVGSESTFGVPEKSRGAELKPGAEPKATLPTAPPTSSQPPTIKKESKPLGGQPEGAGSPLSDEHLLRRAFEAYEATIKVATAIGDSRTESYAWGHLGHLYEQEGRFDEALDLTRRATLAAQQVRAPESLYRWHWQTGRILKAQGKFDEAIQAYRRAVATLQPIRQELLVATRGRQSSFRESTGPLFFELSDLLLRQAASSQNSPRHQELLVQAQDTIESFKAAELQDYFKDECVATARSRSTTVAEESKTTAVIYPIILPDRLELLVSLPTGLKQFIVPVKGDVLIQQVRSFRIALEDPTKNTYRTHAEKLYDWLIRPIEPDLAASRIKTLVFVPDGPLRTIPLAPLHDGKQFLIAKYAIAITPGLTLTDPHPLNRTNISLLSVGLTESVQGFPALPFVSREMRSIHDIYGGKQLLNGQFRLVRVEQELKGAPYSIMHIASHGKVESDVTKSFILAFDDKITMDRLSQLVGLFEYRDSPLELLTLSACETAAGDDRAALGLAGMAIKAGARSALATLWFIDDEATSDLVSEFYRQLQNPSISKAVALQQAQLLLLQDPIRQHPSYWAPFLLINNWL